MQGIFVGTFLIGLREGLEATLIVSIVAAFLKRNGRSVRPMLFGVGVAVAISIGVGVALNLFSESLPQRQQEMLETVIGLVAVVFVTTMIIWMNRNSFKMKGELEREAQQAINTGGTLALALMAFLAVLKEGFETSVFLLAAAQASGGSRWWALLGALTGIGVAIAIGMGIYFGGLRLNLARFFRVTGVFLVLIAAGLVLTSLRTAHEAGWVTIGQQRVFDFSSWMPARSVLGALITGMFGIPTDPRLIEVLGWGLYAVPVLVIFLWPKQLAAEPRTRRRLLLTTAGALALTAAALAIFVPRGGELPGPTRTATGADGHRVSVTLHTGSGTPTGIAIDGAARQIPLQAAGRQTLDGVVVDVWQAKVPTDPGAASDTVTLKELANLNGGRLPVGLAAARTPGPFRVEWAATTQYDVLAHGGSLVHAEATNSRTATLRGGGLASAKTVSVGAPGGDWTTVSSEDQAVAGQIGQTGQAAAEQMLWKAWLPALLTIAALLIASVVFRSTRSPSDNERKRQDHDEASQRDRVATS